MRAIFFKQKFDSVRETINENGILSVVEMFCSEIFKTPFKSMQDKNSMRQTDIK